MIWLCPNNDETKDDPSRRVLRRLFYYTTHSCLDLYLWNISRAKVNRLDSSKGNFWSKPWYPENNRIRWPTAIRKSKLILLADPKFSLWLGVTQTDSRKMPLVVVTGTLVKVWVVPLWHYKILGFLGKTVFLSRIAQQWEEHSCGKACQVVGGRGRQEGRAGGGEDDGGVCGGYNG